MSDNTETDALRIADFIDFPNVHYGHEAAAELRRLHEVNTELVGVLTSIAKNTCCGDCQEARRVAEAVLAKVEASK